MSNVMFQKDGVCQDLHEDFLGGPGVKTPCLSTGGMSSIPVWGTKILHGKKKKNASCIK